MALVLERHCYFYSMLTVSLHGIKVFALHGLYPEEHVLGNHFEVDVDMLFKASLNEQWPFADYTIIRTIVTTIMQEEGKLLEQFVQDIAQTLKKQFPLAEKVKVALRKMNPPMSGEVHFAQVCFEG